jgi:two-component system, sensor histidine kinase and response regulator
MDILQMNNNTNSTENKIESRVLIVDDNPQNIQVLGNILRENGYKISVAMNGKDALNFVNKTIPDLILLDIMMPEMDGYETCKLLKENETTKEIPVIFLTAKVETDDIVKGFSVGGVDYITKPFRKEELLARVRTHLKLKHTEIELRELIRMKDKLFSIIGHDLRGPLGSLMMVMDTVIDPDSKHSDADIKKYLVMMKDSSKSAFNLLENLLNWARSQQKLVQFNPSVNNLTDIIEDNLKVLNSTAVNKSISIKHNLDPQIKAYFDKDSISTVIRNLLSNSLKFTDINGEINISAQTNENEIQVQIKDNGVGMSNEKLGSLFKKDQNISTRGTKGEKGAGLGLLLCKDFVEGNNGKIRVESEPGNGTAFFITLPLNG